MTEVLMRSTTKPKPKRSPAGFRQLVWASTPTSSSPSAGLHPGGQGGRRGCVVREDCLEYALQNGEKFGIWGGMSERERRRIRRQRALARAAAAQAGNVTA